MDYRKILGRLGTVKGEIEAIFGGRGGRKCRIGGKKRAEARQHQVIVELIAACVGGDVSGEPRLAEKHLPFLIQVAVRRCVDKFDAAEKRQIGYSFLGWIAP